MAELNGNQRASSGSDITLSCSDGSSGLNSPTEFGVHCSDMFLDSKDDSVARTEDRTRWGWPLASTRYSITDESIDNNESAEKVNSDLILLSRKAEVTDLELQTLRKQIAKESKRGQDLLQEVVCLREERDFFKEECEKRKGEQQTRNKSNYEGNTWALLEEMRQELNHEKNLNLNLRLQLRKTQDSNSELILAVQDLEQLLEQNRGTDDDEQTALEALVKNHNDANEAYMREQKIMDLCSEIEMYRRDKDDLEMQMEQLALDYEILKQENHDILNKLEQIRLRQQLKLQYECLDSSATIHELENQVKKLESELKNRSNELEKHSMKAHGCNSDLEAITRAKDEQEQRAIRAEEALRLTRWKNANMASRLQDEFKRLSIEMQSTFEANEKVAVKAMTESSHLRLKNSQLEELLQKVKEELQAVKEDYEAQSSDLSKQLKLNNDFKELMQQAREEIQSVKEDYEAQASDLRTQLKLKSNEVDQMLVEIKNQDEVCRSLSAEILVLQSEVDRLTSDIASLAENIKQGEELKAELEQVKALEEERDLLMVRTEREKQNLECLVDSIKKEAEKSAEELNLARCLKDEKDMALKNLQSEMDSLRQSLLEHESEKDKLSKQVFEMKAELKKKDDTLAKMESKLKDSNGRVAAAERTKASSKNNKTEIPYHGSKEAASLRVKIKLLEGQIKQRETIMETSANAFLEKEKDLNKKIEELERNLQELNQSSRVIEDDDNKVVDNVDCTSHINNREKASTIKNDTLFTEMASLREKNSSMETELKELRERYSEISLKFAEVEGEREQLVMSLRSMKNAKKS